MARQVTETLKARYKYTDEVSGENFRKKVEARLFTQKAMLWSEIKRRVATNPAWQWHRPDALDKLKDECVHQDIWRQDGNYVDKGPFPKPATTVKVQELSRDDDTGVAKLRLTPVNGDALYAEFGGQATPASMKLDRRDFETGAEGVVSRRGFDQSARDGRCRGVAQPDHPEIARVHEWR
jgi:hypothetical protein